MDDDNFDAILGSILSHAQTAAKVQFLVYHVFVEGREAFDTLAGKIEGRFQLDKTIVILSGVDSSKDDEPLFLYCNVSPDLEGAYSRQVVVDKISRAYRKACQAFPRRAGSLFGGTSEAIRQTFGPDFIELFNDNNLLN
jgi:hypothetical protein